MWQSLCTLAEVAQSDPSLRDVSVFQGMTWLPAHGEVVGFVSTPMPKNWRTRLLAGHIQPGAKRRGVVQAPVAGQLIGFLSMLAATLPVALPGDRAVAGEGPSG